MPVPKVIQPIHTRLHSDIILQLLRNRQLYLILNPWLLIRIDKLIGMHKHDFPLIKNSSINLYTLSLPQNVVNWYWSYLLEIGW